MCTFALGPSGVRIARQHAIGRVQIAGLPRPPGVSPPYADRSPMAPTMTWSETRRDRCMVTPSSGQPNSGLEAGSGRWPGHTCVEPSPSRLWAMQAAQLGARLATRGDRRCSAARSVHRGPRRCGNVRPSPTTRATAVILNSGPPCARRMRRGQGVGRRLCRGSDPGSADADRGCAHRDDDLRGGVGVHGSAP